MLGKKLYKENFDSDEYTNLANWCNENKAVIEDKCEYYECVATPTPSLDELKQVKINEFKNIRDTEEVQPIEYNGKLYDYDDTSRDRINAAIIALDVSGQSIEWTTADNTNVTVTAADLKGVVASVAIRSNELHVKYRALKTLVEDCTTVEEVNAIAWE